jgi:hypothetical protein
MSPKLEIRKYCTKPFVGNAVHAPVHVFVTRHDQRRLVHAADKKLLTTTVFPSLARPGIDGYEVLFASSNEVISEYVESLTDGLVMPEIMAIGSAKHLADMLGLGLVVANTVHSDLLTSDMWWDLYYYSPNPSLRRVILRDMLVL